MSPCQECGAPLTHPYRPGFCSFECWYANLVRRRNEVMARRKEAARPSRYRARKPAWRAVVTRENHQDHRCQHRHRTKAAALKCARAGAHVDAWCTAERWPDD